MLPPSINVLSNCWFIVNFPKWSEWPCGSVSKPKVPPSVHIKIAIYGCSSHSKCYFHSYWSIPIVIFPVKFWLSHGPKGSPPTGPMVSQGLQHTEPEGVLQGLGPAGHVFHQGGEELQRSDGPPLLGRSILDGTKNLEGSMEKVTTLSHHSFFF